MSDLILKTSNYTLRPLGPADRDAFVAYRQVSDVARYQGWTPDYSADDADHLLSLQPVSFPPPDGQWLQIAIHNAAGVLVGDVALKKCDDQPHTYELGITVSPSSQKCGVAAEVLKGVIKLLFDTHQAHRIVANSDSRNEAVSKLFKRLYFRREGQAVESDYFKGEWCTIDTWAMLRGDFDGTSQARLEMPTVPLLSNW